MIEKIILKFKTPTPMIKTKPISSVNEIMPVYIKFLFGSFCNKADTKISCPAKGIRMNG
jgi:hypothetical protein